jgi:AraC-like DNA-binding protein
MPVTSAQEILSQLRELGPRKLYQAKWITAPVERDEANGIPVHGPAIQYLFKKTGEVEVGYVGAGRYLLKSSANNSRIIVQFGSGRLRFRSSDTQYLSISGLDSDICELLQKIAAECDQIQTSANDDRWINSLGLIQAAMKIITVLHEIVAQTHEGGRKATKAIKINHICNSFGDLIAQNISEPLGLEKTAEKLGLSSRQLIRHLKNSTGLGYAEHVLSKRLIEARKLLMHSSFSVMDIASKCGFSSREQLIRSFNRFFGWTPLQFRKNWIQQSRNHNSLVSLCQVADRQDVIWHSENSPPQSPDDGVAANSQTLIVSNGSQEIIELFWITSHGKPIRMAILDSGAMMYYMRDRSSTSWFVRSLSNQKYCGFVTSEGQCVAVITPEKLV